MEATVTPVVQAVSSGISKLMWALIIIAIILTLFILVDGIILNKFFKKNRWVMCKWGWKKATGLFSRKSKKE